MIKNQFTALVFFTLCFLTVGGHSQDAFQYQAVVRDAGGNLVTGQAVAFRLGILRGGAEGTLVYQERQVTSTNSFGVVTLSVGNGMVLVGSFSSIDWSAGPLWLKTELDLAGGSAWQFMGCSQLVSVPTALYAKNAGSASMPAFSQAEIDTLSAVAGTTVLNTTTNCLNYYTGTVWMALCGNCVPQPETANAGMNQTITGNQTTLSANTPASGTGHWTVVSGNGGIIASPADPHSAFSGNQPGSYTLRWTITTPCGSTYDDVSILFVTSGSAGNDSILFAPYADCTLWPNFDIGNVTETGVLYYICAFIVDDQTVAGATPCWGGFSTLGMDYYQDKIASLRNQGGDIILSFGGANGIELSYAATTEFLARDAYKTVIDAYDLTSIDFDIEGFLVADAASRTRRSKAMKLLQQEYPDLSISLTLPVLQTGLTNDGLAVVQSALAEGVDLTCVNIMAMDYGGSGIDMGAAAIAAGESLFTQLKTLYQNAGYPLTDAQAWKKIGITPMIGQNDVPGEIFYQSDAGDLVAWALSHQINRVAMWSINRDKQCSAPGDPLYSCSHVTQTPYEFSEIFGSVMNP